MERIGREPNPEARERTRDRTKPRKRRFDSGPDPEKIRQEMMKGRERDYQKSSNNEDKGANVSTKKQTYIGNDKHAKRAYIGNIPSDTDHYDLQIFLNISLKEAGG